MDELDDLDFDSAPYIHICLSDDGEPDVETEGFSTWQTKALLREALDFVMSMEGEWHQATTEEDE